MTFASNDLSEAFISYTGYRRLSAPVFNIKHLIEDFGTQRAQQLLPLAEGLLREVSSVPIEFTVDSIEADRARVQCEMKSLHPELTEEALKAIDWCCCFSWR
jgi:hypothetical protein